MKIEIIKNCPSCDTELERVKGQLFCRNEDCSAKNSRLIQNYAKVLKIKGLGEKTIEKLELSTIFDIYNLPVEVYIDKLGETIGTKVHKEVQISKMCRLDNFIAALGIPLVGLATAKKIALNIENISELDYETCRKIGLGTKTSENINKWIKRNYYNIRDLPITFYKSEAQNKGVVCCSGKIEGMTQSEFAKYVEDNGYTFSKNMSGKVDILVTDSETSSKKTKAIQLNKTILNFKQFLEKIENE